MDMTFKVYMIKPDSDSAKSFEKIAPSLGLASREFVVVGEESLSGRLFKKVIDICSNGQLCLIGGLTLTDSGYYCYPQDLVGTNMVVTFDIPKKYLTLEIIETIQELNGGVN